MATINSGNVMLLDKYGNHKKSMHRYWTNMVIINSGNVPLLDKYGNDRQWQFTVIGQIWQ
jgi:hypothetical protein